MHEPWHQLWTLQEEMEVVKDDLWIPEKEEAEGWTARETRHAEVREQREQSGNKLEGGWGGWSMAEGHINLPGYKTLEHLVMLADKLNEARGRHSGWRRKRGRWRVKMEWKRKRDRQQQHLSNRICLTIRSLISIYLG